MASVELRRVTKVYPGAKTRDLAVLDDVDLHVANGELLVLLGPNGSGKTTLLRLIAGLERVTAGEVLLDGQVVTNVAARRRNVAMVFQSGALYPHLTVRQNLKFGAQHQGGVLSRIWSRITNRANVRIGQRSDPHDLQVPQDEQVLDDRVRDTAQRLGIESMLERLPRQLSGGERQRVALGRALVRQPAVFLLDEPLANADMQLRQELRVAFRRARQMVPGTMILVSHDHAEALALGEKVAVLGRGRIQQQGPAHEVFATPRNRFVAEFMGRSAMSFVNGCRKEDSGQAWFESRFGRLALTPKLAALNFKSAEQVDMGWRASAAVATADLSAAGWLGTVQWVELHEDGAVVYVSLRPATSNESQWVSSDQVGSDRNREDENSRDKNNRDRNDPERVSRGETIVAASWKLPEVPQPGTQVRVEIDVSRVYWFDSKSGENLAVSQ